MIQEFVDRFIAVKEATIAELKINKPSGYSDLFNRLVVILKGEQEYEVPDPKRITVIDHGSYQGTIVFVVGEGGYQPSTYWATTWESGSCSGCDTFEAIETCYDPTEEDKQKMAGEYWTLMLHMLQGMKVISR